LKGIIGLKKGNDFNLEPGTKKRNEGKDPEIGIAQQKFFVRALVPSRGMKRLVKYGR